MKKYRLSTTISPKHWSLLNKYSEKLETQQKALERALELLDSSSMVNDTLSEEDKTWLRISRDMRLSAVFLHKGYFQMMLKRADIADFLEYVDQYKPLVYAIEYYYQKPLKECTLKEVFDCMLINARVMNVADNISYTDQGSYYELILVHSFGITMSKMHVIAHENALKTYGVRYESNCSERTVFIKAFKNTGVSGAPVNGKEVTIQKLQAK